VKKLLQKLLNNKKNKEEIFKSSIEPRIKKFKNIVLSKKNISFLHYGHLGDIINCLPTIQEISKTAKCTLYIQKDKAIPGHVVSKDHPFGNVYLSEKAITKFIPLLEKQGYLSKVEIYQNQIIDIDLNFFRELQINFNIDSVRWYSHLTGVHPDLSKKYLDVENHNRFRNFIVIMRSLRRQNKFISYSFLENYKDIVFIGLKDEYDDLKKTIKNLEYYDSVDFLELASIIKNSKIFIGNLSLGYALAEGLKVPRLLESAPDFPLVYPNGPKAYDFYFQSHFENLVEKLHNS
tara:strand:+ start:363 stop:1235 length:873 start_codon:yes stop_codon:yes gene_type:complete